MTSGNQLAPSTSGPSASISSASSPSTRASLRRDLRTSAGAAAKRSRRSWRRTILAGLGGLAVIGMAAAYLSPMGAVIAAPANAEVAPPVTVYASALGDAQTVSIMPADDRATIDRDSYAAALKPKPKPKPTAAAVRGQAASFSVPFVAPNPGTAQAIALKMVTARGWGSDQFSCLVALWQRESGWRVNAYNPSGAYGIPQALPGSKMASAGADWATNPATQIRWGLGYVSARYGTPCGAWGHSNAFGWY